jgi:endo-1,4-beta-xylanase
MLLSNVSFAEPPQVKWNASPAEWVWNVPDAVPGFVHGTVHSKSMDRDIGYNIFLPASYEKDTDKRYPVVYYLHGASGTELSAYELGDVVSDVSKAGKISDTIFVFPNGGHFSKYRDWKDGNVKSETWVISELIPYIDAHYRTIATREGRALCGWSMGGDASLRFAFKYPDMFCAAATMSAAIDWGSENYGDDSIAHLSRANADRVRDKAGLFMVVGEDDSLFKNHQKLIPQLKELNIPFEFKSSPSVGHDLGKMKEQYGAELVIMLDKHLAKAK